MSIFRLVPPAGSPLPARSILPCVLPGLGGRPRSAELLADHLGSLNPFFVSSGRAGLTILLKALRQGSDRREVVIPAYTCFSVPSAVARAGLTIRLCDVDPKTLDLDLNALVRLDLERALCIVPSGLYGLPGRPRHPGADRPEVGRLPRGRRGAMPRGDTRWSGLRQLR